MRTFLRAAALAVGLFLVAGCNANSLVIVTVEGDELVVMVVEGLTTWPQTVPAEGSESPDHPSGANIWDIDDDFALNDGGDDQFDDALSLMVGATSFPFDQDYSELTFYAPVISGADGLVAAVVDDGTYDTPLSGT